MGRSPFIAMLNAEAQSAAGIMLNPTQQSTLRSLNLYDFPIEIWRMGQEVAQAFEVNRLLPGVILIDQGQFVGMISRRRFLEQISRPYGLELFLTRPIECLYRFTNHEVLVLPGDLSIVEAASQALQRSPELLDEPIVIRDSPNHYRLLDAHQLLIAQSEILKDTTQLLNHLYQDLEIANTELQRLATLDGLTELANRRRFDEYLEVEWRRLARDQKPLSLILVDVDYFKLYNDTYGHQAGDRCLQSIAKILQRVVKRPADLVARYGGEEFALILPNTEMKGAIHLVQCIREELKRAAIPHPSSPVNSCITLSLGSATLIPVHKALPTLIIAAADSALYQAKSQGRNRYCLYPF